MQFVPLTILYTYNPDSFIFQEQKLWMRNSSLNPHTGIIQFIQFLDRYRKISHLELFQHHYVLLEREGSIIKYSRCQCTTDYTLTII